VIVAGIHCPVSFKAISTSYASEKTFFTKGGPARQIFRKIFLRYIQNRMNQKISITAKPWSAG